MAVCLSTAARLYGFDTEEAVDLRILNPDGHQLRSGDGLSVHRRDGAPIIDLKGGNHTGWTAVEVARALWRPRALATLDAALRSGARDRGQIRAAAPRQAGRRGIVNVCTLIPLAAPQSESPMESEARLVMIDGGLPVLQDGIVDRKSADVARGYRVAGPEGGRRVRRV